MAGDEKIVRVLALASALDKTTRGITIKEFSETHGYKLRSVYRDIKSMTAAGYPIVEQENRYKLLKGWKAPSQAGIDRDEALALLLAKQLFASFEGTGFAGALESLWNKLGHNVASNPAMAVRPLSAIDYRPHQDTLVTLRRAIAERRLVRITYQRPDLSEPTDRIVEAGELYLDPGLEQLPLIAWCQLRGEVRSFAVHRIAEVVLLDEHYKPRLEASSADKLKNAFRAWSGGVVQYVKLRFAPCVAREIEERKWHHSQVLRRTSENHLELSLKISEPLELERWLLGFGPNVEILQPTWLADKVRAGHQAALASTRAQSPQCSDEHNSKKNTNPEN